MKRVLLALAVVATLGLATASTASAHDGFGYGGYRGGYGGYGHGRGPVCAPVYGHGHHHHHVQRTVLVPHYGHYHAVPVRSTYYRGYNPYYGNHFGIQTNNFRLRVGF